MKNYDELSTISVNTYFTVHNKKCYVYISQSILADVDIASPPLYMPLDFTK